MSELVLLPEDPMERQYFDEMLQGADLDPLALVQQALTLWHKTAEYPQGSYAKMLAIYANEVAKARASLPAAEDAQVWISLEERLPERHAPVALLDVRTFENVGGDWSRNLQAAGYLDDWNGSLERPHWSIRGQGSMCIDAYTHWMHLPAAPAMSQDSKGERK